MDVPLNLYTATNFTLIWLSKNLLCKMGNSSHLMSAIRLPKSTETFSEHIWHSKALCSCMTLIAPFGGHEMMQCGGRVWEVWPQCRLLFANFITFQMQRHYGDLPQNIRPIGRQGRRIRAHTAQVKWSKNVSARQHKITWTRTHICSA